MSAVTVYQDVESSEVRISAAAFDCRTTVQITHSASQHSQRAVRFSLEAVFGADRVPSGISARDEVFVMCWIQMGRELGQRRRIWAIFADGDEVVHVKELACGVWAGTCDRKPDRRASPLSVLLAGCIYGM